MGRVHKYSTRVLAALTVLLGLVVVVSTIVRGGGPVSIGVLMGLGLVALGGARLYLSAPPRAER
jgi:hypothetical protein